jgi:hypothetical protein
LQLAQQIADFSYRVSLYTTGAVPTLVSGDFAINQQALNFNFSQTKNAELFGVLGAQRYYNLLINVRNEGLENSVFTTVYHIPARLDSVDVQDFYSEITGKIDFSLTFDDQSVTNYITRSVDVYTGASLGSAYSTAGYSFFKNVAFLNNAAVQNFSLFASEIPNNTNIYYQFVPYDDFGSGFVYSGGVSGYLKTEVQLLNYDYGIPPVLNFEDRTGLYFSGLSSPQNNYRDGSLIYQTGASGQDLYLVQSGQWKRILSEDVTDSRYVLQSATGDFVTTGQTGIFVTTGQTGDFLTTGTPIETIQLYAKNDESFTLYKGQAVYIGGANGANPLIKRASNTGERTSSKTIGLLAQNLNANEFGYIISEGILEGIDTNAATAGDPMWLGETGDLIFGTGNKPYGNNHLVYLGVVLRKQSNNGKVYIKPQNGFEIEELHRVYAKDANNKDTLMYNSASGSWFARQISTGDVSGLSSYVLQSATGDFVTTNQTGAFLTNSSLSVKEIYIDAAAMLTGISGATPSGTSILNSGMAYDCYAFDPAVTGFTQFKFAMHDHNLGPMRAKFYWTAPGFAAGDVVWGLQSIALGDSELLNSGFAGGAEVIDSFSAGGTGLFISTGATFIPSGNLAAGDMYLFRAYRNAFSASDTLAVNACLLGISIQYTGTSISAW